MTGGIYMAKETKQKTDFVPKTEEEACSVWKIRLSASKEHAIKNFKKKAERYIKDFKGEQWGKLAGTNQDLIVINYIYSIVKSIFPQTYYQDPYFDVIARRPEFAEAEQIVEDVLNEKWQQIRAKMTIKRLHLDQLVVGFGAGKLGYSFVTEKDYSKPNLDMGLEYTEMVKEDDAYFLRVSPLDILFDIEAKHFTEMKWLATRYLLPYDMAKKRFNLDLELTPTSMSDQTYFSKTNTTDIRYKQYFEKVEVWEVQDLERDKFFYVSDGYDKFVDQKPNKYGIGFNTRLFWVNDCPDEIYPISDVSQIEDLNLELNKTRSQMLNHRRKVQRKILAETGAFKNREELNKFLNDDDMQLCELKDGALSQQGQKLMIVQPGLLPPEFYKIDEINKDDIYQVSGVGANQMASEGLISKTATEASIIDRNANLRNSERIDAMNDYCEQVARGLLSIIQKFDTKENSFYAKERQRWIAYTNEDIAGDFSVNIKLGSMQRPNDQTQSELLMNVMPKFLDMARPDGTPVFNAEEIFRQIMKKTGLSESEIQKMINTQPVMQPPPAQQQITGNPAPPEVMPPEAMLPEYGTGGLSENDLMAILSTNPELLGGM
jgi:hypothetical protein